MSERPQPAAQTKKPVRYRRRPNTPRPPLIEASRRLELFWSLTPLAIFMVFFVWGAKVYFGAYRAPDDATVVVHTKQPDPLTLVFLNYHAITPMDLVKAQELSFD